MSEQVVSVAEIERVLVGVADLFPERNLLGRPSAAHEAIGFIRRELLPTASDSAETAWSEGFEAGAHFAVNDHTPSGQSIDPPLNPYAP